MALQRNLHTLDVILRLCAGIALAYLGFVQTSLISNDIIRILLGVFGIVNIIAACLRHCPVYRLAGLSTYRTRD